MTAPTESFRKVFYDLRPAKQVERKMILETLQRLVAAGFPVKDYQYVGMGSIYFVDYVLLHRLLGMRNLLSVEIVSKAERRVLFNKPFQDVAIHMGAIGDVLTKLDRKRPHLIWLDYDHRLLKSDMQDLVLAASVAPESSILVITVDVDPPDSSDKPQDWRDYYEEVAGELLPFGFDIERFARSALGHTTAQILTNAILQGVSGRPSLHYIPLFSFEYSDGHQMLTIGGMIGNDTARQRISSMDVSDLPYLVLNSSAPPFEIRIPRLTRKERVYLDQHMPCEDGWKPKDFDLEPEEITAYRSIYRYFPIYGELLL